MHVCQARTQGIILAVNEPDMCGLQRFHFLWQLSLAVQSIGVVVWWCWQRGAVHSPGVITWLFGDFQFHVQTGSVCRGFTHTSPSFRVLASPRPKKDLIGGYQN